MKKLNFECGLSVNFSIKIYRRNLVFLVHIGPQVYLLGSIVIALARLSVFKYLRDRSLVFPDTLHEVRGQLSKKSDTTKILKGGIKCQKFWFFTFSQKVVITSF